MVFPGEHITYVCGCVRDIDTKAVTFCDTHESQRYNYGELLAVKRRLKETIRQQQRSPRGHNTDYLKRQLCRVRKDKRAFWANFEECPYEEPVAICVE